MNIFNRFKGKIRISQDIPVDKKSKTDDEMKHDVTIALFGAHSAGKSTYVQAICSQKGDDYGRPIRVSPIGSRSQDYIAQLDDSYARGFFPKATVSENQLKLYARYDHSNVGGLVFEMLDPPGEWVEVGGLKHDDPNRIKIQSYVNQADTLFFFAEPNTFDSTLLQKEVEEAIPRLKTWKTEREKYWNRFRGTLEKEMEFDEKLRIFLKYLPIPSERKKHDSSVAEAASFILSCASIGDEEKYDLLEGLFEDWSILALFESNQLNLQPLYWGETMDRAKILPRRPDSLSHQSQVAVEPLVQRVYQLNSIAKELSSTSNPHAPLSARLLRILQSDNLAALRSLIAGLTDLITHSNSKTELLQHKPIAIIVPKCDQLPGFENSSPIISLIPGKLMCLRHTRDLENFKQELTSYWTHEQQFSGAEELIDSLFNEERYGQMIRDLMNIRANFQVFFVTAVGEVFFDQQSRSFLPPVNGPSPRGVRAL